MVSTTKGITENSTIEVGTLGNMKKPSAGKLLSQFLVPLNVTQTLLSAEWDLPKQSARPSGQAVFYGQVFIIIEYI